MRNATDPIKVWLLLVLFTATFEVFADENDKSYCEETTGRSDYAHLKITAHIRKEGYKATAHNAVEADVYLNGVEVGKTPYQDCLPKSLYTIEIKTEGHSPYRKKVMAEPGKSYSIQGIFTIPLTPEGRLELKKKKIELAKKKKEKERKRKLKQWKAALKKWEVETAPIRKQRKPNINYGSIVLVGGVGLAIIGGVLEGSAFNYHDKAEDAYNSWLESNDAQDQSLLDQIENYQNKRNTYHAVGIPCLVLGGIAIVTAISIYAAMPNLPRKPRRPKGLKPPKKKASLRISPILSGNVVGGGLDIAF